MKSLVKMAGCVLAVALLITSCKDGSPEQEEQSYALRGKVEKGPFVAGSKIIAYELTDKLQPTGRSFAGLINSDDGSFALADVKLVSPYVLLDCDGFYFNEVSGKPSDARLNLMALAKLGADATVNVNILTHLERQRVEKLFAGGTGFTQAKEQASNEVLAVFGISPATPLQSEQTELCGSNSALLAISAIVQGYRTEAALTKLLSDISQGIAETGVLNNEDVKNALANDAAILSPASIRQNLETYYQSLGNKAAVPDCGTHLNNFVEKNPAESAGILYPSTGKYGINLLSTEPCRFSGKEQYEASFCAGLQAGRTLRVSVVPQCYEEIIPATDTTAVQTIKQCTDWAFEVPQTEIWIAGQWEEATRSRDFTINGPAQGDLHLYMHGKGKILIDIYENNSITPTRRKTIELE